jgi:hypothetical protein
MDDHRDYFINYAGFQGKQQAENEKYLVASKREQQLC